MPRRIRAVYTEYCIFSMQRMYDSLKYSVNSISKKSIMNENITLVFQVSCVNRTWKSETV